MIDTLIETPDPFAGPIEVGTRVVLDAVKPNAFAGASGVVVSLDGNGLATVALEERDDEFALMIWRIDRMIRSSYQGEEIVSIDGHD